MIDLAPHTDGVILPVRARAGARSDAVTGHHAGTLKVTVTTAPDKGKANRAIIALLAKTLNVRKAQIELLTGQTSPEKRFLITGVTTEQLRLQLDGLLDDI